MELRGSLKMLLSVWARQGGDRVHPVPGKGQGKGEEGEKMGHPAQDRVSAAMLTRKGVIKSKAVLAVVCNKLTAGPRNDSSIISIASAHHASPVYSSISHWNLPKPA